MDHNIDEEKTAFNVRAKASMREYLRSKTWVEKVEAIERMRERSKTARAAMKRAIEDKTASESKVSGDQ
jgi:hypothetical protein